MHTYNKPKLFIAVFLFFIQPSFAQISSIDRQDQILRQQQDNFNQESRKSEFKKIQKERELLKEQKKEQKLQQLKSSKLKKCFAINSIELIDANLLSTNQKRKLTAPFINKCFKSDTLPKIASVIGSFYHDKGYITTQVLLPKQNIKSQNLKIKIIEGKIEKIILNNNGFFDNMKKFSAFGNIEGKEFNVNDINQGIYQINRLKSNKASMEILPGSALGKSVVKVKNEKKFPARAIIGYNNFGNNFTGINQTSFNGEIDNLFSLNDKIKLMNTSNLNDPSNQKDLRIFGGSISIPFTYNTFNYHYTRSKFRGSNQSQNGPIKFTGYSNRNKITIDRVWINNLQNRISTNLSLTAKEAASYVNDQKIETSQRKLSIGAFSIAFNKYFKNGTRLYFKPTYVRGLKILNAKQDDKSLAADIPKAQFQLYKFYLSLSKEFNISKTNIPITLSSEIDAQISKDTLFGSEQFSVGGYHSVRGFRENFITGDHGYYIRNKANIGFGNLIFAASGKKYKHLNMLKFEPFYDYGAVRTKVNSEGGRMSGAGLKAIFSSKEFDASLTYSWGVNRSNLIDSNEKENKMLYFELRAKCC